MQRVRLTGGNGDVVIISADNDTEALPGVFTVNANGKKVKFSPGNLLWDGSKFGFEEHQYDYPTSWNPGHVGHFYWSKDANIARAENFEDGNQNVSDRFFAANDGAIDGYTVLSKNEWNYLIEHSLAKNSSGGNIFNIDGKESIILKPDSFWGTVDDSYTKEAWKQDELLFDLVALPLAGCRVGTDFNEVGSDGLFWSATPDGGDAYYADFDDGFAGTGSNYCSGGCSVRLVSVQ